MKRIPLTQGKFALVDDEDYAFLSRWKWFTYYCHRNWYAVRNRKESDPPSPIMVKMHRVILGVPAGKEIDHINGDGLDNRRANLRIVTRAINMANRHHVQVNRKHKLPMGVYPSRQRFRASMRICGHPVHLGVFLTPDAAHQAYLAARKARIDREMKALPLNNRV